MKFWLLGIGALAVILAGCDAGSTPVAAPQNVPAPPAPPPPPPPGASGPSAPSSDPMLDLSLLPPAQRDDICNQCHLAGDYQVLRSGRTHGDFRPGNHVGEIWTVFVSQTTGDEDTTISVSQVEQMQSSRCYVASGGKIKGLRGAKLGNPYLRWAIGEAAVLGRRHSPLIAQWHERLCAKKGSYKANAIVANQLGRALYFMLKNGTAFDVHQLVGHA